MVSEKIPVISIIGPTAVGKTELSLRIAGLLGGEIISVDSRQVYRYMDVGTDKADLDTRKRVIHHLIDVADPDERFTVMDFVRMAADTAVRIQKRGKRVILAGGTPFYYRALFDGTVQKNLPEDAQIRKNLEKDLQTEGPEKLHQRLMEVDALHAEKLHPNDTYRVLRALEIFKASGGIPPSELYGQNEQRESPFDVLYIGLNRPRELLYKRIEERVREQFEGGYIEEVRWLLDNGFHDSLPSMKGFGYREIALYHAGDLSFDDALEGDIRSTKAFSRRQMTWFKKFCPAVWYDTSGRDVTILAEEICEVCHRHYNKEAAR